MLSPRDVFVGRERELNLLTSRADRALAGSVQMGLIGGPPGIGKSRLAREVAEYARARGARVGSGRTYENFNSPSYWPWTQAIRDVLPQGGADLFRALGASARFITQVVPELASEVAAPEPPLPINAEGAETQQLLICEAVSSLLGELSRAQPLVVVLDDLQWADPASLILLQYVATDSARSSLLILATYRDTEVRPGSLCLRVLAELGRDDMTERLSLSSLSKAEVEAFVVGQLGETFRFARVFEQARGNPFYLRELVHLVDASGVGLNDDVRLPGSVREAVQARLDRLSTPCRELLQLAAVSGIAFSRTLLATALPRDASGLDAWIDEALARRLIEEDTRPGLFEFAHPLIRRTLLDEQGATQRAQRHAQMGQALEAIAGTRTEDVAHQLAEHFQVASTLHPEWTGKALEYSRQAAAAAERAAAWDAAASDYQRCADLAAQGVGEAADEAAFLETVARCRTMLAENDAAIEVQRRAAEIYRTADDHAGLARVVADMLWHLRFTRPEDARVLRDEALARLSGEHPSLRARLLIPHIIDFGDDDERDAREAASLAEAHDLEDVRAILLDREAHRALWTQRWDDAVGAIERAFAAYDALSDPYQATHLRTDAAIVRMITGELDEAELHAERARAYGKAQRARHWEWRAIHHLGGIRLLRGDWREAEVLAGEMRGTFRRQFRALLLALLGRTDDAVAEAAAQADETLGVRNQVPTMIPGLLACAFSSGAADDDAAAALQEWGHAFRRQPYVIFACDALAAVADCVGPLADDELAQLVYERASAWPTIRCGHQIARGLDYPRGSLALRLGDEAAAERWFRTGIGWAVRERCPVELGLNLTGLAQCAQRRGAVADARSNLVRATALFERYDTLPFLWRAQAQLEAVPDPTDEHVGLSPREREVLQLVARGRSNAQVAAALVISPATVARHVSSLLRKTECANRTELADFAARNGLLG